MDIKISAMPAAATIDGSESLEVVQAGANKKTTAADLAAFARLVAINNQVGTAYTLVLSDVGKVVRLNNAAAITVTVPPNATAAIPIGASIALRQTGAGQVTITPDTGVTLNVPADAVAKTSGAHATVMLHKVAADEWDLTGALAAV